MISHACDPPADGRTVDVHVQRRQEDADLLPRPRRRDVRLRRTSVNDPPVSRRDDNARIRGDLPIRISKEEQEEDRQNREHRPRDRPPHHE